ncbi:MAG: cytochrome P450 [Steroidobacteraceae bacterium]
MNLTQSPENAPPEADRTFDVGDPDTLERMIECFARYGDTYRVYVPARRSFSYIIHHPDDVKRVLVTNHRNYTKGLDRDRIKILLGRGLMTSEGEFWTHQRYLMQPFFHRRVITKFAQMIDEANSRFVGQLEVQAARSGTVNITEAMSELTLEIVLRAIFGTDFDEMSEAFSVVARDQARNLEFVYKFRALAKLVGKLVGRRRAAGEEHFDYVAMMMNARDKDTGSGMSEPALIDEALTLVVAGHETTASVLNWTWYLLSQHPDVEAKLHAEITNRSLPRAASLPQSETLVYAQQVLNEAMRLYPPGWLLSRRTIGPDVLGGYQIPAGSNVLLPLYLLHRHPRYWSDPDRFEPERFAPEHEATRPRFAFMPFAAGPRHCIGETLALYEMLIHLQWVVPRYRLAFVADRPLELEAQINLRTRHPLYMRIERR